MNEKDLVCQTLRHAQQCKDIQNTPVPLEDPNAKTLSALLEDLTVLQGLIDGAPSSFDKSGLQAEVRLTFQMVELLHSIWEAQMTALGVTKERERVVRKQRALAGSANAAKIDHQVWVAVEFCCTCVRTALDNHQNVQGRCPGKEGLEFACGHALSQAFCGIGGTLQGYFPSPQSAAKCRKLPQSGTKCPKLQQIAAKRHKVPQLPEIAAKCRKVPQSEVAWPQIPQSAAKCRELPQSAANCRELPQTAAKCRELLRSAANRCNPLGRPLPSSPADELHHGDTWNILQTSCPCTGWGWEFATSSSIAVRCCCSMTRS